MAAYSDSDDSQADCAIVISPGTNFLDAGFAGDDAPRVVFPPIVGRTRATGLMVGMWRETYVGDEAWSKRGILDLNYPLSCRNDALEDSAGANGAARFNKHCGPVTGAVVDFDDFERILHHTFYNELRVAPEEHPLLMVEPVMNPNDAREKTCQIAFETFNTPAFYLEQDSKLALYSSGRLTGLVVDLGHEQAQVTPWKSNDDKKDEPELLAPPTKVAVNGATLTEELIQRLEQYGYQMQTNADRATAVDMKEKLCCLKSRPDDDTSTIDEDGYELPDGLRIRMTPECRLVPEALFDPSLLSSANEKWKIGAMAHGQDLVSAIHDAAAALPHEMYANIVLVGGSSMFKNLPERIHRELAKTLANERLKVIAESSRKDSTWIGGSILADLSTMKERWLTKDLYDENGPTIVTQRLPSGDVKFSSGSMTKAARA